jgi:magnesium-protoporphyrin IX monomethyl ester (oxidative) cyclase
VTPDHLVGARVAHAFDHAGVVARIRRLGLSAAAAFTFGKLFFRRPRRHALPAETRMAPVW